MKAPLLTVLTGDVVKSSQLDATQLDAVMQALESASERACGWTGVPARFTRFRGDGWQCLASDTALRTVLVLRASVRALGRGLDTRISIGTAPGAPTGRGLAEENGAAFETSGHGLDTMPRIARWAVAGSGITPQVQVLYTLCEQISRHWTPAQATVMAQALEPAAKTQAVIGESLGTSQQMVAKHLAAAGYWALDQAVSVLESDRGV